jgi:hypothetical protein
VEVAQQFKEGWLLFCLMRFISSTQPKALFLQKKAFLFLKQLAPLEGFYGFGCFFEKKKGLRNSNK